MTKHEEVEPLSNADIVRLKLYDRPNADLYRRLLARLDDTLGRLGSWICPLCLSGDHSNHNGPNSSHCVTFQTNVPAEVQCACRIIYLKHRPLTCTVVGVGPRGLVYKEHGRLSYANGKTVSEDHVSTKLQLAEPDHLQGLANLLGQQFAADDEIRGRAQYLLSVLVERSRDKRSR